MSEVRTAILRGTKAAARLHNEFEIRSRIESSGGNVKVFEIILGARLPLLFRPLENLLGAFLPTPVPGILVTTQRPLSVQRLTAAHELGHSTLGHRPSLDDETILTRSPFTGRPDYDLQEVEADAFAIELLMPRWLFAVHAKRQRWTAKELVDPATVYQLALRLGVSYEATCRSLARYGVLNGASAQQLLRIKPRTIKQQLTHGYEPVDWRRDVWILTEHDEGSIIEGSQSDVFLLRLREHSGAGYLWSFTKLNESGFAIVRDERETLNGENVGGEVMRWITAQSGCRHSGSLVLTEARPWLIDGEPLSSFTVHYDLSGPEAEGWSTAERRGVFRAA